MPNIPLYLHQKKSWFPLRLWKWPIIIGFVFGLPSLAAQIVPNNEDCPELVFTTEQCCFTPGSVITFNWEGGCPNAQVNLYLVDPTTLNPVITITTATPNNGYFTWNIPTNITLGTYLLYIEDVGLNDWDYGAEATIASSCSDDKACNCQPDFDFGLLTDGCSLSFTPAFTDNCRIETLLWDFGDNTSSNNNTPSHTYSQNGEYTVCLTVSFTDLSSNQTCTEKICKKVSIETCTDCCPVIPLFGYDIEKCRVDFISLNKRNDCSRIINWSWDFGDGSPPVSQPNPSHTYSQNGTYQACLTATIQTTDGLSFQTTICRTIIIEECEETVGCCPLETQFIFGIEPSPDGRCQVSFSGNVDPTHCQDKVDWAWDFGDGNSSALQNPQHTYIAPGVYQVCLTAHYQDSQEESCRDRFCQEVQLSGCSGGPTPCLSPEVPVTVIEEQVSICAGGSAQLAATPTGTFQWNPSTGLSCTTCPNPVASPEATTTYTVNHIDLDGCISSDQITVVVGDTFDLDLPDLVACPGESGFLNPNPISGNYLWQPATGLSCIDCPNPEFVLTEETTYTFTVVDGNCIATDEVTVLMHPSGDLNFTSQIQEGLPVNFTATPSGLDSYSWNFGDPASGPHNTASGIQVSHEFSTPNINYTVCLEGEDDCGPVTICHEVFYECDCTDPASDREKP